MDMDVGRSCHGLVMDMDFQDGHVHGLVMDMAGREQNSMATPWQESVEPMSMGSPRLVLSGIPIVCTIRSMLILSVTGVWRRLVMDMAPGDSCHGLVMDTASGTVMSMGWSWTWQAVYRNPWPSHVHGQHWGHPAC